MHNLRDVHGQKVRFFVLESLGPQPQWIQILPWTLDSFMSGSYPVILRNVGGSTQVPANAEVFLHQ